jgi:hypothetical protein
VTTFLALAVVAIFFLLVIFGSPSDAAGGCGGG